ncbi:adenosylmethionine--8-amino-7-oxononanoate transaminase [Buchnera aphidicola]|uniref:Adenosylmethionine-8-amino-7-oxononanoate aminotransferase n=1 Tax=Buchnera aphidicola (Stegophylla sp.) TaxID=2315800 RepID=A0A4D6YK87_9GAMM|nr:adenosylmethionine--8-amino-7-oxononanoate transaminase [Buchnera aphidicola (Stegophylla sp.)]QCI26364.1 adenosylmethionine--8-amino-7-oxononanoate transaminase [Buchnera aphidicola (Stegophylla sp.)]
MNQYLQFNFKHIWHPYDSMTTPFPCYMVHNAHGIYLNLINGVKIIDGMSSWWSAIHGYNHPRLNMALKNQIDKMSHVMFGGITHLPAIQLCQKLISILPKQLECIFLADSGSVSIEVAMKVALQYSNVLNKHKKVFLTIRNGYHGDTFSAMSVCDPDNSIHNLYFKFLPKNLFAYSPTSSFLGQWKHSDINSFLNLLITHKSIIAAVILEPIVQGVGGMKFYHAEYLKQVRFLCDKHQILLIIDEIATGFGRTGKMFAYEHAKIIPDIVCLGKALTGGTMTLSAMVTKREIANVISNHEPYKLMHGPTFMGNPLACSVACENINILQEGMWKKQIYNIEKQLKKELLPLMNHPYVFDVRILGGIAVVECKYIINVKLMQKFFVDHGVWIKPFKKLIYLTPPYIIDSVSLAKLIHAIQYAIHNKLLFLK